MSPLLALLCVMPAAYSLPDGRTLSYDLNVQMDGFLPLLGGQEATCDLKLGVSVRGLARDADGAMRASSELTSMKVIFNGAELPFGLENIKAYFPKTTVSLSPQGKVLKTDAPNTALPVRLPGLDVKRFPEISYLPIEFPEPGLEEGKPWSFERSFNGAKMTYTCDLKAVKDGVAEIEVKVDQAFESLENAGAQAVSDPKDALNKVATSVKGSGKVLFDLAKGIAKEVAIEALATSVVTDLKTGATKDRKLKTTLKVKLTSSAGPISVGAVSLAEPRQSFAEPRQSFAEPRQSFAEPRRPLAEPRQSFAEPRQSFAEHRGSFAEHRGSFGEHRGSLGEHRRSFSVHRERQSVHRERWTEHRVRFTTG